MIQSQQNERNTLTYKYTLRFDSGSVKNLVARLDAETLDLISPVVEPFPPWTRLDFHQCPNCPVDVLSFSYCPVAINLDPLIEATKDIQSHFVIDARVETENRIYIKRTSAQVVMSSLIGIYMPTSGCPILNKLRPMVETHLPFSTINDTIYRMTSMYLLGQYFLMKNGNKPNWELSGLSDLLEDVQLVNIGMTERLNSIEDIDKETSLNAINILNCLSQSANVSIQYDDLKHWEKIFIDHYNR